MHIAHTKIPWVSLIAFVWENWILRGIDERFEKEISVILSREAITYLITSKCPRPELHDTRLLVEGEVRYVDCTRTLKSMKKIKFIKP